MSYNLSDEYKDKIDSLVIKEDVSYDDVKNVLEDILNPNKIYPEVYVPISFLFSEYGSKLIKSLYNNGLDSVTPKIAATELGVTKQYINKILKSGKLKGTNKDGNWIIKRADLEEFKKSRK